MINVPSVTFVVCYTVVEMARTNRGSAKNLSTTHPVLTGESRADAKLWRLLFVPVEIAEQAI